MIQAARAAGKARLPFVFLLAGVLAAVLAYLFWPSDQAPAPVDPPPLAPLPAPQTPPPASQPPPSPAEPAAAPPPADADAEAGADADATSTAPLPALRDSDSFVREQTDALGLPSAWMAGDDLMRRFAVLLDNAARGELPARRPSLLSPRRKFAVRSEGERFFLDAAGYARYDPYLDQLEGIPPETLVRFFFLLRPLTEQALGELGYGGAAQDAALAAIDQALATPVVEGEVELVQPKVLFHYADPALEDLGGLQKQVLRMGPRNARRLQAYLTRLRPLLD